MTRVPVVLGIWEGGVGGGKGNESARKAQLQRNQMARKTGKWEMGPGGSWDWEV